MNTSISAPCYQLEANKHEARSKIYQQLANLQEMLWFKHPAAAAAKTTISIYGNELELSDLRKHPALADLVEKEIKEKMRELNHTLATKEFP